LELGGAGKTTFSKALHLGFKPRSSLSFKIDDYYLDVSKRNHTPGSVKQQYYDTFEPMHKQLVEPSMQYADICVARRRSGRLDGKSHVRTKS
jgi:uridine kinase